jgi:hypothetical protein
MRAVQITRFGGPEVLDIVDVPEPTPGPGQQLYDVSIAGPNFAAPTTACRSRQIASRRSRPLSASGAKDLGSRACPWF